MAYSPTPQSTSLPSMSQFGNSNSFHRLERKSPSPDNHQNAPTKRDRRRMALQDRLAEISSNFAENRDANYRKQLQQYQSDINFINNAHLYDNVPLLEPGIEEEANALFTGSASGWQQLPGLPNGNGWHENQAKAGRHAIRFVHEVNDTMEQRDVDLTASAYNFNFSIQQYEKDYTFAVEVAEKEHQRLLKSLRQQLIANVQQKKATLHREKEKLDIADTNALLHYPNQFSINHTASPGGPQSNRKTRHTRHRLDADDLDTAIDNSTTNGKRKRKAVVEGESGGPTGPTQARETEPITTNGFKDAQPRLEIPTGPPQAYTLNRLFTDRELNANLQEATYEVIRSHTSLTASNASNSKHANKRRKPNSSVPADTLLPAKTADPTEFEENASVTNAANIQNMDHGASTDALAATAMDRTPSQLYHATRSAGRLQSSMTTDPASSLGELAGRHSAADLIGSYNRANEKPKKADNGDDYQRAPPLTDQEALEDVRLMEKAMRRVEASFFHQRRGGEEDEDDDRDGEEEEEEEDDDDDDGDDDDNVGDEQMEGDRGRGDGRGAAAIRARRKNLSSVDRKVLELAVGEDKGDFVGPMGFGTMVDNRHGDGGGSGEYGSGGDRDVVMEG